MPPADVLPLPTPDPAEPPAAATQPDADLAGAIRDLVRTLRRPAVAAELLAARDAARLAGMSTASWHRYVSAGLAPAPIRVGSCVRWSRSTLAAWITAGCPDRRTWDAQRKS